MKIFIILALGLCTIGCTKKTGSYASGKLLLEQLKNTHANKDWFVPIKIAVADLTAEQSNWKDSTENHSIGQLVSHLTFWNERLLIAFKGNVLPNFDGNNEATFEMSDETKWIYAIKKLDSLQNTWENLIENASGKDLEKWSSSIANMCMHNAYHTGQIIYIRKKNGWWRSSK